MPLQYLNRDALCRPWPDSRSHIRLVSDRMKSELRIDYVAGLRTVCSRPLEDIIDVMRTELPHVWLNRYHAMCDGPTNVLEVTVHEVSYLYDFCAELMERGELPQGAREDRAVVAYGRSRAAQIGRDSTRIAGFPGSDERGDRGHLVAHAAGGGLDINIFHQNTHLNRGWSAQGKRYREMERYCARHAGTFFFSRLIYADATSRPAEIEFGIMKPDATLWVEVFENVAA